jgi:hypothetical protein
MPDERVHDKFLMFPTRSSYSKSNTRSSTFWDIDGA